MDVARRLSCSKICTARSEDRLDALSAYANLPWAIKAPFFCRYLLYVLEDEIWRALCGGDHFLKCMFSTWKTKNKSVSPLHPWHFFLNAFILWFLIHDMWHFLCENQGETQTFWCQLLHRRQLLIFGNLYFPTERLVQLQVRLWSLDIRQNKSTSSTPQI